MINGAWGGRPNKDGIGAITNPSQNMSNMPVEIMEAAHPVLVEEYTLRAGTAAAPASTAAASACAQYRLLADEAMLQLRADRAATALWPVRRRARRRRRATSSRSATPRAAAEQDHREVDSGR